MALEFVFTPEEAHAVAEAVSRWFRQRRFRYELEAQLSKDAPYRTTFVTRTPLPKLVEAQGTFSYHRAIAGLAAWLMARRVYAELYIAVDAEATISGHALEQMKVDGVGLLLVIPDGTIVESHPARTPALHVTPDPTLRYGDCTAEVAAAITKFNTVNRKDGLRDMCELVERETAKLAAAAARKGMLKMNEAVVRGMDWSSQINTLASSNAVNPGSTPVLDEAMKNDFHSFRGARNLVDHPARTRRDDTRRLRQFTERMTQGPRLVAELVALRRRVTRN
jgi:hypothetical protein